MALLLATAANFHSNSESVAHNVYAFLIVTAGIDVSIINTVAILGPSVANIFKGIANYFFPHFLPAASEAQEIRKTLRLHLLLTSLTSVSVCLVTTYFHKREDKTMQDYVSFNSGHLSVLLLNVAVAIVYFCSSVFRGFRKPMI